MPTVPDDHVGQDAHALELNLLADELAHAALAQILQRRIIVDIEAVAIANGNGVKVALFLYPLPPGSPYPPGWADGVRQFLDGLARSPVARDNHPLAIVREIDEAILEAAPRPDAEPVTMKKLARLAGYAYTNYFRDAVNALADAGLLVRSRRGIRRSPVAARTNGER